MGGGVVGCDDAELFQLPHIIALILGQETHQAVKVRGIVEHQ